MTANRVNLRDQALSSVATFSSAKLLWEFVMSGAAEGAGCSGGGSCFEESILVSGTFSKSLSISVSIDSISTSSISTTACPFFKICHLCTPELITGSESSEKHGYSKVQSQKGIYARRSAGDCHGGRDFDRRSLGNVVLRPEGL